MNLKFFTIYLILLCGSMGRMYAQISPSFTQFFINPYRINASYAGIEGRPALHLANRMQWANIEGAPFTSTLTFHTPLKFGVNFGFDFFNDKRGITSTNAASMTIGYAVAFSRKSFLRFGLSGGVGYRNLDWSQVDNPSDPAIINAAEKNLYLLGNFGLSFHTGYFSMGVSLPNVFGQNLNNPEGFVMDTLSPLSEVVAHASQRIYFGMDDFAFEPHVLYRYSDIQPHQFEVAGIFHLKHILWFGGSYRQDYGVSGLIGLKFSNTMAIGYSYGIGTASLPGIGSATHEFDLSFRFGEKQRSRRSKKKKQNVYISFVDTERVIIEPEKKPVVVVEPKPEVPDRDRVSRFSDERELEHHEVIPVMSETIYAGSHEDELGKGSYVVAREFNDEKSANDFKNVLNTKKFNAEYGYATEKSKWVVYIASNDTMVGLNRIAQDAQGTPETKDVYILSVE